MSTEQQAHRKRINRRINKMRTSEGIFKVESRMRPINIIGKKRKCSFEMQRNKHKIIIKLS